MRIIVSNGFFDEEFRIGRRAVGGRSESYIIAEAGVSHFRSIDKAIRLCDIARSANVDAIKFQGYQTKYLVNKRVSKDWFDRLAAKEVDKKFYAEVKQYCDEIGLEFLLTPHEPSVLEWISDLKVPAVKIGSGERGNFTFLTEVFELGLPVLISTGMHDEHHILDLLDFCKGLKKTDVALLHCVSAYPIPVDELNLRAITRLKQIFNGVVGYSDHSDGTLALSLALSLGSQIIEKHISLDFNVANSQDWKVSLGPESLANGVEELRLTERMLGSGDKSIQGCEIEATAWALKGSYSIKPVAAGEKLQDVRLLRPSFQESDPGIKESLCGRKVNCDLDAFDPIYKGNLSD